MADLYLRSPLPNAFDDTAAQYDRDFSHRSIGRLLRGQVWRRLAPIVKPGMRVLDLGCGTGEDALWLAKQGCMVSACDGSLAMLAQVREKAACAGAAIETGIIDLNAPGELAGPYDFVLANFGVLNCVTDLGAFAATLRKTMNPRGVVALVTMGRFCVWETLWFGLRLDRRAFRRWGGSATGIVGDKTLSIHYWNAHEIATTFQPKFRLETVHGIGLFLPPSYLFSFFEDWPRLLKALSRLEREYGSSRRLAWAADHQLTILRRSTEVSEP